jgi:signal peptidase II
VVDMFYFPIISGVYPEWIPFVGGSDFQFFRPVFNVADSSISIGIFSIILFYRKEFSELTSKEHEPAKEETEVTNETVTTPEKESNETSQV